MPEAASATQSWTQLIIAALGIVGTLGGALGSQWWQSRAAARRMAHERQLESERWERDERRRLREERRATYEGFLSTAESLMGKLARTSVSIGVDDLHQLAIDFERVRLLGSVDVIEGARQITRAITSAMRDRQAGKYEDRRPYHDGQKTFLIAARRDLGSNEGFAEAMLLTEPAE